MVRHPTRRTRLDPDWPLVEEAQARSALLFGPPGTGKTTLVEALAGALGWDYLEILPSTFLTDGLDNVAARADKIFSQLMELNRCVILFDEFDELIRDRGDVFSDPFGRFLTTTMLPKLAKLWAQRRVLFFASTNWITKADPAIRRSQRFDAVLFVAPPSIERKRAALKPLLVKGDYAKVTGAKVAEALSDQKNPLGWLALMRHEHISDLQQLLKKPGNQRATYEELGNALEIIGRQLEKTDWHRPSSDDSSPEDQPGAKSLEPYALFSVMANNESVDGSRECFAWLRTGEYSGAPIRSDSLLIVDSRSVPKSTLVFELGKGIRGPLLQYG
jgi:DNA polymerase III delta prime subunit